MLYCLWIIILITIASFSLYLCVTPLEIILVFLNISYARRYAKGCFAMLLSVCCFSIMVLSDWVHHDYTRKNLIEQISFKKWWLQQSIFPEIWICYGWRQCNTPGMGPRLWPSRRRDGPSSNNHRPQRTGKVVLLSTTDHQAIVINLKE